MFRKILKVRLFMAVAMPVAILWSLLPASVGIAGDVNELVKITWMSEQYAPYNWKDDGKKASPQGIFVDVLREVVGNRIPFESITFYPWARSYHIAQTQPNTALFLMTETAERRKLFKLSKPVMKSVIGVICRKSVIEGLRHKGLIPKNFAHGKNPNDAKLLAHITVGVVRDDIGDALLQEFKVAPKDIRRTPSLDKLTRRLMQGRVDAIAYNTHVAQWNFKTMANSHTALNPKDFELLYVLAEKPVGFSFHKDTSQEVINAFNEKLDRIKASGKLEDIVKKYLH